MAIKVWKPEFSNSNEVAPEQPSNLRVEESKNTQETWKPSLNIPSHKPTQKELNKEVTDEFSSREEAEKWLNSPEQQNLSKEAKAHIRSRFDRAFGGETKPNATFKHSGINFEMSPEQRSYFDANPKEFKELLQQAKESGYDKIKVAGNGKGWSVDDTSDSEKNREIIESSKRELKGDKASIRGTVRQSEMPEKEASMDDIMTYLGENRDYFDPESTIENVAYEVADAVGGQPQQVLDLLKKEAESYGLKFDPYANYKQWWEKEEEIERQKGNNADNFPLPDSSKTLRERFNDYLEYGLEGANVDEWNNEIMEIEKMLPFKDRAEHNKWLDLGSTWSGDDKWLNMTENLIKRAEKGWKPQPEPQEITKDKVLSDYLKTGVKQSGYDENTFETPDGAEYLVLNEEEALQYAKDDIQSTIDDLGLEAFSPNFQDWIINNAIDSNWLAQIRDEEADYLEGENEHEQAEQMRNMDDDETISWLKDIYGSRDFAAFVGENIDWEKVKDEAISWDGIAHFVSRYDGKEIELPNGLYAYRVN